MKYFKIQFILFLIVISLFLVNNALAECYCPSGSTCPSGCSGTAATCASPCAWRDSSQDQGSSRTVKLEDPLGLKGDKPIQTLIGKIINAVLGIVGSLALVMFIYGGFVWMTAAGNNERIERGKNVLIWATIGLVIIFSAYAIVFFIFSNVLNLSP